MRVKEKETSSCKSIVYRKQYDSLFRVLKEAYKKVGKNHM